MAGVRGRSGRKKKPLEQHEREGTGRPDRGTTRDTYLPPDAPRPKPSLPRPPSWIPGYAKTVFKRTAKLLHELGLLSQMDRDAIAAYSIAVNDLRDAQAAIKQHGRVIETEKGALVTNPACAQSSRALELIKGYTAMFGLSPADRGRVLQATWGTASLPTSGTPGKETPEAPNGEGEDTESVALRLCGPA